MIREPVGNRVDRLWSEPERWIYRRPGACSGLDQSMIDEKLEIHTKYEIRVEYRVEDRRSRPGNPSNHQQTRPYGDAAVWQTPMAHFFPQAGELSNGINAEAAWRAGSTVPKGGRLQLWLYSYHSKVDLTQRLSPGVIDTPKEGSPWPLL